MAEAIRGWNVIAKSLLAVLPLPAALLFSQTASKPHPTSAVHFAVFDDFGRPPYQVTRFVEKRTGIDYSRFFNGLDSHDLPHGEYEYLLKRTDIKKPAWSPIKGRIHVYRPEHWLELNPSGIYQASQNDEALSEFDGYLRVPIIGTVTPIPVGWSPLWIRIEFAHSNNRFETGVDNKGEFRIDTVLWGACVVVVFDKDGRVIHAEPLNIENPKDLKRLAIELKKPE